MTFDPRMTFDPQEAERLADSIVPEKWYLDATSQIRELKERVRELEDERDEMAPIISRAYELEHRIAAAEKVIEAVRWAVEHKPYRDNLERALQEYDEPKNNVTTTNQPRPQGWVDAHISSQALQEYDRG